MSLGSTFYLLWRVVFFGTVVSSVKVNINLKRVEYEVYDADAFNVFNITEIEYKPIPNKEPHNALRIIFEFRQVVPDFDITFSMSWADQTNKASNIIPITMRLSGCNWISGNEKKTNRIMRIIAEGFLLGGSVVPKKCPIPAGKLYTVKNFYLTNDHYPAFMPSMNIRVNFSWYMNNKITYSVLVDYDIRKVRL